MDLSGLNAVVIGRSSPSQKRGHPLSEVNAIVLVSVQHLEPDACTVQSERLRLQDCASSIKRLPFYRHLATRWRRSGVDSLAERNGSTVLPLRPIAFVAAKRGQITRQRKRCLCALALDGRYLSRCISETQDVLASEQRVLASAACMCGQITCA